MVEPCENYKALLMGFMDDELTPEEKIDVNEHLVRCADCRDTYDELVSVTSKLEGIAFDLPSDSELRQLWRSPYSKLTRFTGLFLIALGVLVLTIYGVYQLTVTRDVTSLTKFGIATVIIGLIILFFQVIRDRLKTYKSDPYKEVER